MEGASDVAVFTKRAGCFLNLNELEFSDTNAEELKKRGFVLADDESNSVLGSAAVAKAAFDAGGKTNFCSSRYKDAIQLRLRFLRTAQSTAREFDEITEDGTVMYGQIDVPAGFLEPFTSFLIEMELPQKAFFVNPEKNTVETACGIAEELAVIFAEGDMEDFGKVKIRIIERYPFENGFIVGSEQIF
ncbi:MAG: hypothetical protein FWE78_04340 [Methanimicrococcus sp.]|nr:hypothetical protein [Methanimicrococcus sp.]